MPFGPTFNDHLVDDVVGPVESAHWNKALVVDVVEETFIERPHGVLPVQRVLRASNDVMDDIIGEGAQCSLDVARAFRLEVFRQ